MKHVAVADIVASVAVVGLLAISGHGCTGSSPSRPSPTISPAQAPAELSAAQSSARFAIDRDADARLVRVLVASIDNPARQGLVLQVFVEDRDRGAGRRIPVGQVSPFPADRPGAFQLVLPDEAAKVVNGSDAVLVVTLAPALPTQALRSDLRAVVDASVTAT